MGHTGKSEALKAKDPLYALRHSAAHVMAQAVRRLYPDAKLAIGPPIEDGFYYDLDLPVKLTDEDLPKIEAAMRKIMKENHSFRQSFMTKTEAAALFTQRGERFKLEIIDTIPDDQVSIYTWISGDSIRQWSWRPALCALGYPVPTNATNAQRARSP